MANTNSRCIIPMPSVNYAMSAVILLTSRGITARQIKTDPRNGKPGCSNAVEVGCNDLARARSILIKNSIPIA